MSSWMMNLIVGGFLSDWVRDCMLRTLILGATPRKEPRKTSSRISINTGLLALNFVNPRVVCVSRFPKIGFIQFRLFQT